MLGPYLSRANRRNFDICRCSFCCVFMVIFISLFVAFFGTLIFWLSYSPNAVKFYVTDATLLQFNFTANNKLNYNLTVTMIARNPNKKITINYDHVESSAYFKEQWFDTVDLPPFWQGHKNTTILQMVFEGQELVFLDNRHVSKLNSEKSSGVYGIDVNLNFRIGPKFGKFKTGHSDHTIVCNLKVPLSSVGKSAGGFKSTKCRGGSFFRYRDDDGLVFSFGG